MKINDDGAMYSIKNQLSFLFEIFKQSVVRQYTTDAIIHFRYNHWFWIQPKITNKKILDSQPTRF